MSMNQPECQEEADYYTQQQEEEPMKTKLITLHVEEIITGYPPKPEIHRLESSGIRMLDSDFNNYKRHIFKLVVLRQPDKQDEFYYIESEDFEKTMLFISDIIRRETETLLREIDDFERKEIDYRVKIAHLTDQLAFINNKWFVRFYRFLENLIKKD